jgi:hypothetical protein
VERSSERIIGKGQDEVKYKKERETVGEGGKGIRKREDERQKTRKKL